MDNIVVMCILGIICIRQFLTILSLFKVLNFYKYNFPKNFSQLENYPFVVIAIPVLCEQAIIEETLKHFNNINYPNYEVVIITTEIESIQGDNYCKKTTIDIINQMKTKYNFKTLHFPDLDGKKADQLNYLIDKFEEIFNDKSINNSFIAIYDADSRPNINSLRHFAYLNSKYSNINIFQQSSIFYLTLNKNTNKFFNKIKCLFLNANIIRQNRFTFAYEVARIVNRNYYYRKIPSWRSLVGFFTYAHCAGHGLFIRISFVKKNPFPSKEILEDMFYGFILNYLKEPIKILYSLDYAEMPTNLKTLFHQKARWFLGPLRTFKYYKYAKKQYSTKFKIYQILIIISGWFDSFNWMLTAPLMVFVFLILVDIFIFGNPYIKILAVLTIVLYLISIFIILIKHKYFLKLIDLSNSKKTFSFLYNFLIIIIYPFVIIFHSLTSFFCIINVILYKNTKNIEMKTERL